MEVEGTLNFWYLGTGTPGGADRGEFPPPSGHAGGFGLSGRRMNGRFP